MSSPPSPTRSTFSNSSNEEVASTNKQTRRTSRFIEGEPNTLQDMPSLHLQNYKAIMAEMDNYESSTSTKQQPSNTMPMAMSLGRKFGTKHRRGGSNSSENSVGSSASDRSLKASSPPVSSPLGVEMWARRSLDALNEQEKSVGDKIKKGLGRLSVTPSRRTGMKVEGYSGV